MCAGCSARGLTGSVGVDDITVGNLGQLISLVFCRWLLVR